MTYHSGALFFVLCLTAVPSGLGAQSPEVDHPTELDFPPFQYAPPRASGFREEIGEGVRAYLAEDRQFPLVSIRAMVRAGSLYDPEGKEGLSQLLSRFLRQAATKDHTAARIEQILDDAGGELQVSPGRVAIELATSVHSDAAREAIAIVIGLLRQPRFLAGAIDREKENRERTVSGVSTPEAHVRSELYRILYEGHPVARPPAPDLLSTLTVRDLEGHHGRYFRPANVVLTVAGDFERAAMKEWLEAGFRGWRAAPPEFPEVPASLPPPKRRIVLIHRPGMREAFGHMGHAGVRVSDPDYFAAQVMNWILTGGQRASIPLFAGSRGARSFAARLWYELRTVRGMTSLGYGELYDTYHYPPPFLIYWKGREEHTAEVLSTIWSEIQRIRDEPVTPFELETAKAFHLHSVPSNFHSGEMIARTLGRLEFDGAPIDYYERLQKAVRALSAEELQRAARKFLRPEELVTVILGDADRILQHARRAGVDLEAIAPVEVVRR